MNEKFYDLEWHDARMINFQIGENSGKQEIVLDMEWPEDPPSRLIFKDVYGCRFKFGGIGIYESLILTADVFLINEMDWKKLFPFKSYQNGLKFYSIDWGSSEYSDKIEIMAKNFVVEE